MHTWLVVKSVIRLVRRQNVTQLLNRKVKTRLLYQMSYIHSEDTVPLVFDKAYINGQWTQAKNGKTFVVTNPANGKILGSVPDMDASDTGEAIKHAYRAFQTWKETTAKERCALMRRWADLCNQHKDNLQKLITLENGKPLQDSLAELNYGIGFIDLFAEDAKRVEGNIIPTNTHSRRLLVLKQPIGVCGMITPWNFPHAMITRKAAAAIAAGCTVVLKPAEDTPLSALALCKLSEEAGIPSGVLNVVTSSRTNTPEVGKVLCKSPLVQHISFTGSTAVGKLLLSQSASTIKKVALELGGNAPFIIFESADLSAAVRGVIGCKFRCSGQTCVCANRIFVQENIYDTFTRELSNAMDKELKLGDGCNPKTTQGPLINKQAIQKVDVLVKDAISKGATVVRGGTRTEGNFYEPTLLSDVSSDMRCAREEIFGPIAGLIRFKTEEEVVALANATPWGLAAESKSTGCACPRTYIPVCGKDGKTYSNKCSMECVGSLLEYEGSCVTKKPSPECACPMVVDMVCGKDNKSYDNECQMKCSGIQKLHHGPCGSHPLCACPYMLHRVCGSDGKTYDNECLLNCASVTKAHDGECLEAVQFSGSGCLCNHMYNPVCGSDGVKYSNECWMRCAGASYVQDGDCPPPGCHCPHLYKPVCGANKVTYDNECLMNCQSVKKYYDGACKP